MLVSARVSRANAARLSTSSPKLGRLRRRAADTRLIGMVGTPGRLRPYTATKSSAWLVRRVGGQSSSRSHTAAAVAQDAGVWPAVRSPELMTM